MTDLSAAVAFVVASSSATAAPTAATASAPSAARTLSASRLTRPRLIIRITLGREVLEVVVDGRPVRTRHLHGLELAIALSDETKLDTLARIQSAVPIADYVLITHIRVLLIVIARDEAIAAHRIEPNHLAVHFAPCFCGRHIVCTAVLAEVTTTGSS